MKCQILFSGKNKKNISKCRLLKILPRVLSVKKSSVKCDECKFESVYPSNLKRHKRVCHAKTYVLPVGRLFPLDIT